MKARFLTLGQPVKISLFGGPRIYTFLGRSRTQSGCFKSLFQCDDFRGQNGPNDLGLCTMTDQRVAKLAQVPTVAETRAALKKDFRALLTAIQNQNSKI